jgi:hypothetical protein
VNTTELAVIRQTGKGGGEGGIGDPNQPSGHWFNGVVHGALVIAFGKVVWPVPLKSPRSPEPAKFG